MSIGFRWFAVVASLFWMGCAAEVASPEEGDGEVGAAEQEQRKETGPGAVVYTLTVEGNRTVTCTTCTAVGAGGKECSDCSDGNVYLCPNSLMGCASEP